MLWLVTPVHGRVALTRLCLEQRARMLEELELLGVQARQLVVGNDANLETAREFGFTVLERANVLGWRVNEGFEWACLEGGADAVAYCGSDDWHLAAYFARLPKPGTARTCAWQAFVPPSGDRLVVMATRSPSGGAPWVLSRELLEPCTYRPADNRAMRGVDGSIARGLYEAIDARVKGTNNERRLAKKRAFAFDRDAHALRVVDFKGGAEQVTPWEDIDVLARPRELDTDSPFEELARVYPVDLVERMERFYAEKGAP